MRREPFPERTVRAATTAVLPARTLMPFDPGRWNLRRGLSAALACCVPLLLAEWAGEPTLSWASLIGFWVSLVDPAWPLRHRLLSIAGFVVATAVGCFVAVLLRPYLWASGAFALVWCIGAILTRIWGDASGSAGNLSALSVIIALGDDHPSSLEAAAVIAAVTLGGGLWGLGLAVCIVRQRPDMPLCSALADVFRSEAAFLRDMMNERAVMVRAAATSLPHRGAVRDAIEQARDRLVAARREGFGDGVLLRRLSLILGDAEEVLRALLALREMMEDAAEAELPHAALAGLVARLGGLASMLATGGDAPAPSFPPIGLDASNSIAASLSHAIAWTEAAARHMAGPMDTGTTDRAIVQDARLDRLGQLRNNLSLDSLSMRHALRFGLTAASLTLLTKGLDLDMGYWITLTAIIIMQAYPSATWQRAVQRVAGTMVGGLIATIAVYVLQGPAAVLVVIAPLSLLAMAVQSASYALYIVCITPMFILITELFSHGGVLSPELGGVRMIDNVLGAAAGMLATFVLWPSWESRYLRRRLADDLRANGAFLLAALQSASGALTPQQSDAARRRAGLAGNNAEASLRRALDEPRRRPVDEIAAAMLVTAVSRRLSGIAAAIVQCGQSDGARRDLAQCCRALQEQIEEVANAIAETRTPASRPHQPVPTSEMSEVEQLVARAERQLAIATEAARSLSARRGPDSSRVDETKGPSRRSR